MARYSFTVDLVPVKRRARADRQGHVYVDKDTEREMKAVADAYEGPRFAGPVTVGISTCRKLPKSTPKKVESEPDCYTPDVDNIAKAVLDALNGKAWEDDKCVTVLHMEKRPRTRIDHEFTEIIITGETEDEDDETSL